MLLLVQLTRISWIDEVRTGILQQQENVINPTKCHLWILNVLNWCRRQFITLETFGARTFASKYYLHF